MMRGRTMLNAAAVFACLFAVAAPQRAQAQEDPFAAAVRPTDAKTPEQEQRAFHAPPGFVVELFAAEPQIQKPLNMAFDARGRLWVSCTEEYPYPAPQGRKAKDTIRVLEDADGDGRAEKSTVFADDLNIPIGLYPYKNGVIAFSIPYIYNMQDTDGDGKADTREILYGPLGYDRDAHGLNNGFRRGFDGWLYACHGYNNNSTIKGKDGSRIDVNSGNVYRIRLDGSRVEQFTHGQVNPFGLTFTPEGDVYSADCHTKPLMLLLRDGWYDSFGKPHNGLGYVPGIMEHLHGSTAIAGIAQAIGSNFPEVYQGNMFVGNVMTSRVDRDELVRTGSSVRAEERPDFLSSDDPWFRPVDLQIAPDGTMYVADFYNKIIGHYEVPLDHPGRDRKRGRIWRVRYVGEPGKPAALDPKPNLRAATADELIKAFAHPVLTVRMLAIDEVSDRIGKSAQGPLVKALESPVANVRVSAMWALHRLGLLTPDAIKTAAADRDGLVRIHAMRVISETPSSDRSLAGLAEEGLADPDPLVKRAAADALGRRAEIKDLDVLIKAYQQTPANDIHLRHELKLALLSCARLPRAVFAWSHAPGGARSKEAKGLMAEIALAVPTAEAAGYLLEEVKAGAIAPARLAEVLKHVARHAPGDAGAEEIAKIARSAFARDLDFQYELLTAVRGGIAERGGAQPPAIQSWGADLARELLDSTADRRSDWSARTLEGGESPEWRLEPRRSAGLPGQAPFLSSLPLGERYRGVIRSQVFAVPASLSFDVCGHLGFPNQPAIPANKVRLVLEDGGTVIAEALAPRNDVARKVTWNLESVAGKRARIEVIDGIDESAYAWIAVARFEPAVVAIPVDDPAIIAQRERAGASLAEQFHVGSLEPRLREIAEERSMDVSVRAAAAAAVVSFHPDAVRGSLVRSALDRTFDAGARDRILDLALAGGAPAELKSLGELAKTLAEPAQARLALALSETARGGDALLTLAEQGAISPRALLQPAIRDRVAAARVKDFETRLGKLTADLPSLSESARKLIEERQLSFRMSGGDRDRGAEVFSKNCSACHQIAGKGGLVGPQLDGIGTRGADRLIEDILDPNRNIDPNFYATNLALSDGRVITGLIRRTEGANLIVADASGKELAIAENAIEEKKTTKLSPMPVDFAATISAPAFQDLLAFLANQSKTASPITWRVVPIEKRFRSEGAAIADLNNDGRPDIIVGELYYQAPDWKKVEITKPGDYGDGANGYSRVFYCFADDINHDGWIDVITIGMPGEQCQWYENPKGAKSHWTPHPIWPSACNETPLYVDLFKNGKRVLVMATQPPGQQEQGQMAWFAPGADVTAPWTLHPISAPSRPGAETPCTRRFSHGLGVGDLNGDGRLDVICTEGWWEQPQAVGDAPWPFHPVHLGEPAAHMHAIDIEGKGIADVISSSAHGYGIWRQKQILGPDGARSFEKVDLFPKLVSQTHALLHTDIDGDGLADLVTGKRFWAHGPKGDVGQNDPAMLYWLKASRDDKGRISFTPIEIHNDSGVGLHFAIGDVNGDGAPDIVVSNKKGVFLFEQVRPKK